MGRDGIWEYVKQLLINHTIQLGHATMENANGSQNDDANTTTNDDDGDDGSVGFLNKLMN